ncbi:MAG: rhomboid family intramembrane serine protease [Thermoflexibacter sp.]|jgi:membrane associated rhomboid family serine protease|nr:rhomboid family intramembrane serine protease [Thermoflexibacter sp.]
MPILADITLWILISITVYVSWQGFRDGLYFDKYLFEVDGILIDKQYYRLLSAGFLHGDWWHLLFNMLSLYIFFIALSHVLAIGSILAIYFGSMLFGNLLALYIHRNHGDYSAIGASGGVCGIIFAYICIAPEALISIFFMPYQIPAWAFGLLYILVSIYGIKKQNGNIGHEAHLGGALGGMLIVILLSPYVLKANYLPILLITTPALIFLALVIYKPQILFVPHYGGIFSPTQKEVPPKNYDGLDDETALNELLEKVGEVGYQNLSKQEKKKLEELSKKIER